MAVRLLRSYLGYPSGNTVELGVKTEAALIAQNLAEAALIANITTGAVTANVPQGTVAIAAGASSVVVTNALVDASTKVWACVAQATADGTLLRVERVVNANGSFTIFGTANATATTLIDWAVLPTIEYSGS